MIDTDPLDELLESARPRTASRTVELREELTRMAVASAREQRSTRSRHRVGIGTGITTIALLAGAGTAAATGVIDWMPWAQHPDVVYAYALPSGETCELRVVFDDAATGAIARDVVADVDLASEVDVDDAISELRSMRRIASDEFGNTWDTGYGTEFYPAADAEYDEAVQQAVAEVLFTVLTARGVEPQAQDSAFASTCSVERANAY
jgi:hypothetical protein